MKTTQPTQFPMIQTLITKRIRQSVASFLVATMDIRPILQCVDIMNNPWSSAEQKQESNDYLNQFLKSPDYHLVAIEIMQSEDPSICFVDLVQ